MKINIVEKISCSLELNSYAKEFIHDLNQFDEEKFIIDFSGVIFISRTFAQAYYVAKRDSPKTITEINLSSDVKPMMEMVEKQIIKDVNP